MKEKKLPTTLDYIVYITISVVVVFLGALIYLQSGDGFILIPFYAIFQVIWLLGILKLTPAKTIQHKIMLVSFIILFNPFSALYLIKWLESILD